MPASTKSAPITIGRTTKKTPPIATIPDSLPHTAMANVPVTKFAANTVLTPLSTFGFAYRIGGIVAFENGKPRIVSPPLRAAVIAASNARAAKYGAPSQLVKETV